MGSYPMWMWCEGVAWLQALEQAMKRFTCLFGRWMIWLALTCFEAKEMALVCSIINIVGIGWSPYMDLFSNVEDWRNSSWNDLAPILSDVSEPTWVGVVNPRQVSIKSTGRISSISFCLLCEEIMSLFPLSSALLEACMSCASKHRIRSFCQNRWLSYSRSCLNYVGKLVLT